MTRLNSCFVVLLMNLFLCQFVDGSPQIYYVDITHVNADDSNSGFDPDYPLLTIQEAADRVGPGDTVYVKATGLWYDPFEVMASGTDEDPIQFVGYKSTPGDRDGGVGIPTSYANLGSQSGELPLIDGGDRTTGRGIEIEGYEYVFIRNFHITGVRTGVDLYDSSSNCEIENIYCWDVGNLSVNNSGTGIFIRGASTGDRAENNFVANCVIYNAAQNGIALVHADDNDVEDCQVFADDDSTAFSAADYYFLVQNGDCNDFYRCNAERSADLSHGGHGFCLTSWDGHDCIGNTFELCDALNIQGAFELRGDGTNDNCYVNCYSNVDDNSDPLAWGAIAIKAGANENYFDQMRLDNSRMSVRFEGPSSEYENEAVTAGYDNVFVNCIFESRQRAIELSSYPDESTEEENLSDGADLLVLFNDFFNCTFVGISSSEHTARFFQLERPANYNRLKNCIIVDFEDWDEGPVVPYNSGYTHSPLGFSFDYCCLHGNTSFPAVGTLGSNNITSDPQFTGNDYDIEEESDCVDAGTSTGYAYDYDGDSRDASYDIGAQEFQD